MARSALLISLRLRLAGRSFRAAGLLLALLILSGAAPALAQRRPAGTTVPRDVDVRTPPTITRDTSTSLLGPSPARVDADSARSDSLRLAARPKGAIQTTVNYKAIDSIRFEVTSKKAFLYNKADVDYGDLSLKAALITVNYGQNLLTANGATDTTGRLRDRPLFKQGTTVYEAEQINYNFKTRKGRINGAVTQQGEGFVHAEAVKKNALNEIYGRNGRYTTCNLEHPHFYINASKMKVIPGQEVVTGPFNLVIGGIPTPLGFLFGYFPTPKRGRASGLIIPTFGQSNDRGFFLRNGGYYWVPNANIGVRLTGDIYSGAAQTFGGWRGVAEMQYTKRYRYTGLLSFSYSQQPASRILDNTNQNADQPTYINRTPRTFWLSWNHSPTPRPGGGRFSASVQAGSNNYNQQNSLNIQRYLTPAFSSNVSYSKQLRNLPINYSVQASQSQNTQTGTMDFTLPSLTVGVARQYLYDLLGLKPRPLYEQLAVTYTMSAQNRISNTLPATSLEGGAIPLIGGASQSRVIPVNFSNLTTLLRNSQTGIQHNFQISLGSYTADQLFGGLLDRVAFLKHVNVAPSVSYGETWYFKKLNYQFIDAAQAVRIDTTAGFYRVYNYSGSVSLGTNIYGLYQIKGKKIEAIRHKVTPNVSYAYSPDFSRNSNFYLLNPDLGNIRNSAGQLYNQQRNGSGSPINPLSFSYFNNFPYGVPNGRRVSSMNFSVQNALEMKVRDSEDTTGTTPFKKVNLINNLGLSTSYNFAADSLKLSALTASFNTQVARKLSVTMNAQFDFYQRDSTGRTINKYLIEQGRLTRLVNAGLQLSYQFNPASGNKKSAVPRELAPTNDPALDRRVNPYEDYVDFSIPWELSANFTASYTDPGPRVAAFGYRRPQALGSASLNMSGRVTLTEHLNFGYSTGYDFKNNNVTITSFDFTRDLHCWQITGNWRPFGYTQGYYVTIAAKSSLLQSLKLSRNKTFLNN